jgi:thioredoxin reductase (NADPH)
VADYEILVAGGGPAGLTAGLFAARHGRSTLVLDHLGVGGSILNTERIEDFPGFPEGIPGFELGPAMQEQVEAAGAVFEIGGITVIERHGDEWLVASDSKELTAGAVIVATGAQPRKLGVPREEEFEGRGLSNCATCDGPLFRGKLVAVAGGGDSALLETVELTRLGVQTVVVNAGEQFAAQDTYVRRVEESPLVEVRHGTRIVQIVGNGSIEGVVVEATGASETLSVSGLFVQVGRVPNTTFLEGVVALDGDGCVPTDIWMSTEAPGLYAAGEIRSNSAGQAVTAAGDGATAAIAAHRYLAAG